MDKGRRVLLLMAILVLVLLFSRGKALAAAVTVYVDGVTVSSDVAPAVIGGRVMVPMRAIFEALGAKVTWNGDT